MEAKLSNFGIHRIAIWKSISVETASGTSLAIHLAEVAEAGTWVVYDTERLSPAESNTPSQISFPCVMGWFLNIWAVETHSVTQLVLDTQEYQTHAACVPEVKTKSKL